MTIITVTNTSDNGSGSLRVAISKAKSGDTIKFDPSLKNQTITLDSQIGIQTSLIIDGSNASGLTISGGEKTNIFRLGKENQSLTVRNLTLADSYYEAAAGGAIWANKNSTVEIENINFINNVSDGAALHGHQGSTITVTNSTFDNNDGAKISDKKYSAGAISLFAYGSLTVKDSVFTDNQGYGGGAIKVTSSDLIVEDSIFVGNDSTAGADKSFVDVPGGGGAIYLDAASVPNDPRFYSGPLERETEGGEFIVRNSRFEGNRGAGQGGAIMAYGYNQDRILIKDSEIINNEVIKNQSGIAEGGGLWLMGFVEIDNTIIANNKSADLGGGLFIRGEVPAEISNSDFSGNQAVNGGAIYNRLWASQIEINNTNFDSNSASNKAGVFYAHNKLPFSFQNSQFTNNTPDDLTDVNLGNNFADIRHGSDFEDTIVGTNKNSYLIGLNDKDLLKGNGGNDYLDGGNNDDTLWGGNGSDTLIGGNGINYLVGGDGNDVFIGGNGKDLIEGGNGSDRFIIGDDDRLFYTNQTWYDQAIIKDFEPQKDVIQLKGEASDYTVKSANNQGVYGTGIFYNGGMVALIGDVSPDDFSLNAKYIDYGTSDDSGNSDDDNLLELTGDSIFSGEPDYNPSDRDGLIIWQTDDTWYVEATGDANGSRITGQIVSDTPIEDLGFYKLESNDRVEFADNSDKIIEFDLRIGSKWTDGFSFQANDDSSVFLELSDRSQDTSIAVGSNLQEI